ncbi:hypothetical protein PV11_08847 [Exophiala sideris]|uniref:Uncharacterized protein n=1 Tax=Exophiala sideris TaxID=1016849 RepID=A0A0D1Y2B3_9EURO|nr:hypothetical protein PV11_08847 [Exophiala sideris]
MATPRLSFLYPNFLRAVRACEPTTYQSIRFPPASKYNRKTNLHTSAHRRQDAIPQRYGPAAGSGLPPPPKPEEPLTPKEDAQQPKEAAQKPPHHKTSHTEADTGQDDPQESNTPSDYVDEASMTKTRGQIKPDEQDKLENKELDMVLSIPSPSEVKGKDSPIHPHLEPPPYEHHFDTYGLVQQLAEENAYTIRQAERLMKAIRLMLSLNLDVAKEGLVSKSDIDNESYLFRAACAELKTTLQATRHSETLKQRSQRAQLQHEFDILNQKVTQDLLTLKEELKGFFNDRKMMLQEDKRKIDSKISELNYEITVLLNSDAKSDVEGLRWVLTRRAALAIGACAFMIISALNYSSIRGREKDEAEKKRKALQKAQDEERAREQARYTTPSRSSGTQTEERTMAESLG